jgi:hypothetical protein
MIQLLLLLLLPLPLLRCFCYVQCTAPHEAVKKFAFMIMIVVI